MRFHMSGLNIRKTDIIITSLLNLPVLPFLFAEDNPVFTYETVAKSLVMAMLLFFAHLFVLWLTNQCTRRALRQEGTSFIIYMFFAVFCPFLGGIDFYVATGTLSYTSYVAAWLGAMIGMYMMLVSCIIAIVREEITSYFTRRGLCRSSF